MPELARGSVGERPWGLTLGALGARKITGHLRLQSDDKRFAIAFEDGAVVGASSPFPADTATRIAATSGLATSVQMAEVSRRLAAAPERDEIEMIGEVANLTAEQLDRLRRRMVAQRAARTFSVERGDFVIIDALPARPQCAVDVRPIIYLGALMNMSDERLSADLRRFGRHFRIKPTAIADLPRFGFTDAERQVARTLETGSSLPELEAIYRELDSRTIMAVVYTLLASMACEAVSPESIVVPRTATRARDQQRVVLPEMPRDEPATASRDSSNSIATTRTRTNQLLSFVAVPREPATIAPSLAAGSAGVQAPLEGLPTLPRATTPPPTERRPRSSTPFGAPSSPRSPGKPTKP